MLVCMSVLSALIGASCLACGPHFYQRIESISKQFCGRCYFSCAQEHLSYPDIKYLLQYIRSRKTEKVKDELISSIINQEDNIESIPLKESREEQPCTSKSEALAHEIDLKETEQKIISYTDITKTPSETGSVNNTPLKAPEIPIVIKDSKTVLTSNTTLERVEPPLNISASDPIIAKALDKEVSDQINLPQVSSSEREAKSEVMPRESDIAYKQKPSKVIFSQKVSQISVSPRISNEVIKPEETNNFPIHTTPEGSRATIFPASSASSIATKRSGNSQTSLSSTKTVLQKDSKILDQKKPSALSNLNNNSKSSVQGNSLKLSFEGKSSDKNQKINKRILKRKSETSKKSSNSSCSCTTLNKCSGAYLNKEPERPDKENPSKDSETSMKSILQPGSETAVLLKSSGSYVTALASETSIKSKNSDVAAKQNILEKSSSEKAAEKKSMLKIKQFLISKIYTKANPNPSNLAVTQSGSLIPIAPYNSETSICFEDIELCELLMKPLIPKTLRHLSAVTENVSGTEVEKQG